MVPRSVSCAGTVRPFTAATREIDLNEHSIRLRGGWECRPAAPAESPPKRLVLPTRWTSDQTGLVTLTRRFGRPPLDAAREALFLRLDQVPGIRSLHVNGQPLAPISPASSQYEFPLAGLLDRNQIDVEVDIAAAGARSAAPGLDWGLISLVIGTAEDHG
ncbi:MAG: hypothetical protein ACLQIB_42925 [Isosphaeraceae bacterium]